MTSPNKKFVSLHQTGFSLVEIMVGMVIGLLATMVVMQVFAVFEGQKRSTTGGADAQTNGSTALYSIAREAAVAGYGLTAFSNMTNAPMQCLTFTPATDISPVTITDGGAGVGASDSITLRYGDTNTGGVPVVMQAGTAGTTAVLQYNPCQAPNEAALVSNGTNCTLTRVTGISASGVVPVTTTLALGNNVAATASLACLGTWRQVTYTVINNQLVRQEARPVASPAFVATSDPIIADIVNIQAQYGMITPPITPLNDQITQWVDAPVAIANRNLVRAIRVAIVARNGLREKNIVTNTCTTNQGTVNNGPCAWDDTPFINATGAAISGGAAPKIDLSNDINWQYYRYRVYETIIPLRQMIWSGSMGAL